MADASHFFFSIVGAGVGAGEPAPAVEPVPIEPTPAVAPDADADSHAGQDHAVAAGHMDATHAADPGHAFHFDFDAVRAHHTMPYPAIEWFHHKPVIIFNLAGYAGKNVGVLSQDPAFAAADANVHVAWATKKAELYGTTPETLAKAMVVADSKDVLTFPQALSWFNNQTFIGTVALLLFTIILFIKRPKKGQVKPQGAVQHMLESVVLFIRDDVVRPNLKGPAAHHAHAHDDHHGHPAPVAASGHVLAASPYAYADRWVPHFSALFLGILAFNLVGLIPGGGSASGNPGVTLAFALTTLLAMLLYGFKEQGFVRFWINLVPVKWSWKPMDMLVWCLLFLIELMGLLIKPAALAIRLAANMFAGHTAVLAFATLGFIIFAGDQSQHVMSLGLGAVGWVIAVALYFLELLVAFIQAYIFTLLSAIFIGTSIHPEH